MHYSESRIYDNNGVCGDATEGENDLEINIVPEARDSERRVRKNREYVVWVDVMYAGYVHPGPRPRLPSLTALIILMTLIRGLAV